MWTYREGGDISVAVLVRKCLGVDARVARVSSMLTAFFQEITEILKLQRSVD